MPTVRRRKTPSRRDQLTELQFDVLGLGGIPLRRGQGEEWRAQFGARLPQLLHDYVLRSDDPPRSGAAGAARAAESRRTGGPRCSGISTALSRAHRASFGDHARRRPETGLPRLPRHRRPGLPGGVCSGAEGFIRRLRGRDQAHPIAGPNRGVTVSGRHPRPRRPSSRREVYVSRPVGAYQAP
jgi:hypothetical protein